MSLSRLAREAGRAGAHMRRLQRLVCMAQVLARGTDEPALLAVDARVAQLVNDVDPFAVLLGPLGRLEAGGGGADRIEGRGALVPRRLGDDVRESSGVAVPSPSGPLLSVAESHYSTAFAERGEAGAARRLPLRADAVVGRGVRPTADPARTADDPAQNVVLERVRERADGAVANRVSERAAAYADPAQALALLTERFRAANVLGAFRAPVGRALAESPRDHHVAPLESTVAGRAGAFAVTERSVAQSLAAGGATSAVTEYVARWTLTESSAPRTNAEYGAARADMEPAVVDAALESSGRARERRLTQASNGGEHLVEISEVRPPAARDRDTGEATGHGVPSSNDVSSAIGISAPSGVAASTGVSPTTTGASPANGPSAATDVAAANGPPITRPARGFERPLTGLRRLAALATESLPPDVSAENLSNADVSASLAPAERRLDELLERLLRAEARAHGIDAEGLVR